jgi:hypothetical protein
VQSPRIIWPDCWAGIPKLGLQDLSSRVDEATAIWSFCAIVAGERAVNGTAWCIAVWNIVSRWIVEVSEGELREEATDESAERPNRGYFERHVDDGINEKQ